MNKGIYGFSSFSILIMVAQVCNWEQHVNLYCIRVVRPRQAHFAKKRIRRSGSILTGSGESLLGPRGSEQRSVDKLQFCGGEFPFFDRLACLFALIIHA